MRNYQRIFAILLTLLMALSTFGCLVSDKKAESAVEMGEPGPVAVPEPAEIPSAEPQETANAGEFDGEAIAIELGDIKLKAEDVANSLVQYLDMFSYYGDLDEETVAQCVSMTEEELVRYYVPLWKANELGMTLSAEKEAEIAAEADEAVEEERNALLCQFAYYYGGAAEYYEDASLLTAEEKKAAEDEINAQLAEMFYEGFLFDDYLETERENYLEEYRIDALSALLRSQTETGALSDEEVDAWYRETLEAQQKKYTDAPEEFYYDGDGDVPVLYVPDGYLRVQVIELVPDGEIDAKIEENGAAMRALEAEYGALALSGGNPARMAEIESEYAAMAAENAALEDAFYGEVRAKIGEAYAALQGGASFEDAMQTYNAPDEEGSGRDERYVYVNGDDKHYPEIAALAKTLKAGEYSEPTLLDGRYVIVKVAEVLKEGPVDRASIESEIRAAAAAVRAEEAYDEQFDAWFTEAMQIVVFHRETYEMVPDLYLN